MAVILSIMLTGCKVWEESWEEIKPLPDVEIPVDPDPWEPTDGNQVHEE